MLDTFKIHLVQHLNILYKVVSKVKMSENEYKQIIRTKFEELAYIYFMKKRRLKGKEINYLKQPNISEYLLHNDK